MDSPWRLEGYSPSSACEVAPYEMLEPEHLQNEIKDLSDYTRSILNLPYDPEPWIYRGQCLRLLGYPELALGDLYKARLLVEAALQDCTALGDNVVLTFGMKMWYVHMEDSAWKQWELTIRTSELLRTRVMDIMKFLELRIWNELMEALMASNACADYLCLSREAVLKFPLDKIFPSEVANAESWWQQRVAILQAEQSAGDMTKATMESTLHNGGVFPTAYPWMDEDVLSRDKKCIQQMEEEFKSKSTNCNVARSSIRNVLDDTEENGGENDVLGVFASRNIKDKEIVLTDSTVAGVVSTAECCTVCCDRIKAGVTNPCCNDLYCSKVCSKTAVDTFHSSICSRDFTFLYEAANSAKMNTEFSLDALLLLRVLSLAIREGASHPLRTSLISRLTPAYEVDHLIIFNFSDHIVTPIQILQELGIDVFANPNYDTWVIHTLRCRLQNNKHGQNLDNLFGTAVHPLYSMFNHSCAPNVDWEHEGSTSTLNLFAERDIAEGEELFISYIKPLDMKWAERQKALMPWLGMECECQRCKDERPSERVMA